MATGKKQKQKLEPKLVSTTSMNTDRISSLPDSVLLHILSFLPMKTSVTTSVLSRRWRHLWEYLQVFDFKDCLFKSSDRFVDFVNRVLTLRRLRDVKKFSLSRDVSDFRHDAATWIRAAAGPLLQELNISLYRPKSTPAKLFYLPQCIFTCTSLVSLTLRGGIEYSKLSSVHLPSFKNLRMDIFESDPMDKVLSGCPVLETLQVKFKPRGRISKLICPSLKRLTFEYHAYLDIDSLEISTPLLEYLDINLKTSCHRFSVSNLDNVVQAHLDIAFEDDEHVCFVPDLLKALCRTRLLVLEAATTERLLLAPRLDFPEFSCLLSLQLGIPYFDSGLLKDVLRNCRMLQALIINSCEDTPPDRSHEPCCWTEATIGPTCVTSRLEIFKFGEYHDFADEHAFVVHILEAGLVLKKMTIHCDTILDLEEKHDILKGLSMISRGSNRCQLEFE